MNSIFCKSFSNIPSLTVGVRQRAACISIQTNPDRKGGDVAEVRKPILRQLAQKARVYALQ